MASPIAEITPLELKKRLDAKEDIQLIDVREQDEREICQIGGELIPLATLPEQISKISKSKPVIVYCRSGGRSGRAVEALQDQHNFKNVINLRGGILAWIEQIDPTLQAY